MKVGRKKQVRFKRLWAGTLVIMMLVQSVPLSAFATKSNQNNQLVINGSFSEVNEDGSIPGWDVFKSSETSAEIERKEKGGKDGAYIYMNPQDGASVLQTSSDSVIQVEGGEKYRIQYYAKSEGRLSLEMAQYNAEGSEVFSDLNLAEYTVAGEKDWKKIEFTFTTEEDAVYLFVAFTALTGESAVDEVSIKKTSSSKLMASSFASASTLTSQATVTDHTTSLPSNYWPTTSMVQSDFTNTGVFGTWAGEVPSGINAGEIMSSSSKVWLQTYALDQVIGTTYKMSFYIWVSEATNGFKFDIAKLLNGTNITTDYLSKNDKGFTVTCDGVPTTDSFTTTTGGWKHVEVTWTATSADKIRLRLRTYNANAGTVYIDDLYIADAQYVPEVETVSDHTDSLPDDYFPDTTLVQSDFTNTGVFGTWAVEVPSGVGAGMITSSSSKVWLQTYKLAQEAGKTYKLSFYIWVTEAAEGFKFDIAKTDANGNNAVDYLSRNDKGFVVTCDEVATTDSFNAEMDGWKHVEVTWTATSNDQIRMRLRTYNTNAGTVYLDDLYIAEDVNAQLPVSVTDHTDELTSDYFPTTTLVKSDFTDTSMFGTWAGEVPSGVDAGKAESTSSKIWLQTVKLAQEAGATYKLSFYVWVTEAAEGFKFDIAKADENGQNALDYLSRNDKGFTVTCEGVATTDSFNAKMDGWKRVEVTWTATTSDSIRMRLRTYNANVGTVYLDDLYITQSEKADTRIITNGGFEKYDNTLKTIRDWDLKTAFQSADGVSEWTVVTGTEHGNALEFVKAKSGNASLYHAETTKFEAGKTYRITYWVKNNATKNTQAQMFLKLMGYNAETSLILSEDLVSGDFDTNKRNTNGEWERVSVIYTMPEDLSTMKLRFVFPAKTGGDKDQVTWQLADFKAEEYVETDFRIITNGDFAEYTSADVTDWKVTADEFKSGISSWQVETGTEYGNALKIVKANKNGNAFLGHSKTTRMIPGKTYKISYWVKNDATKSADAKSYTVLRFWHGETFDNVMMNGSAGNANTLIRNTDGKWQRIEFIYTIPENTTSVELRQVFEGMPDASKKNTTWYFADFRAEETEPLVIADDGLVKNGSFTAMNGSEAAYWPSKNANSDGSTVEYFPDEKGCIVDGFDSKGFVRITNRCATAGSYVGISQGMKVEANTYYILRFNLRAHDDVALSRARIHATQLISETDYTELPYKDELRYDLTLNDTKDWQQVELCFKTGEKTGYIQLNFFSMYPFENGKTSVVDVDNFSMKKTVLVNGNWNFEASDVSPYGWASDSTTAGGKVGIAANGSYNGSNALKLTTASEKIAQTGVAADPIKVKANTIYEVTYHAKLSGGVTARGWIQPKELKADGTGASATFDKTSKTLTKESVWISPSFYCYQLGNTGWQEMKFSFMTDQQADTLKIEFFAYGPNVTFLIDDVTITEVKTPTNSEALGDYLDFENTDSKGSVVGWATGTARSQETILKSDNKVYHSGERSAYIKKDGTTSVFGVYSPAKFVITPGMTYEFSFWVCSKNSSPNAQIRMNLVYYDQDGNRMFTTGGSERTAGGTYHYLNGGSERSEWQQVITRMTIPEDSWPIRYAAVRFTIAYGSAELWLDDIFIDIVEDGTDIVVDHNDFHAVDQDGVISGWEMVSESGKATFKTAVQNGNRYGVLENESGKNYMKLTTNTLETQYRYTVIGRYKASQSAVATMEFYNWRGDAVASSVKAVNLPKTDEWEEFIIEFTAPSCTTAALLAGLEESGTLQVDDIIIYMTGQPITGGNWQGYWVWYNEDAKKDAQYQSRYFRQHIYLPSKATYAPLQLTADDHCAVYVNGELIHDSRNNSEDTWAAVKVLYLEKYLKEGENVIAVEVVNGVSEAGLLYDGKWTLENGEEFQCITDTSVLVSKKADGDAWTKADYNDGSWEQVVALGKPPVSPWGAIFYDSTIYSTNAIEIVEIKGDGDLVTDGVFAFEMTLKLEEKLTSNFPMNVDIWVKNSVDEVSSSQLTLMDHTDMSEWPVGKEFTVKFQMNVPSYLESGYYTLQWDDKYLPISNDDIFDMKFISFELLQEVNYSAAEVEVKRVNGAPTLVVDGELTPFYAYARPDYNYYTWDYEPQMVNSGIDLYVVRQGSLGKGGMDVCWPAEGVADFDAFDDPIYETLANNSEARLIIQLGLYAPEWWLEANPDEQVQLDIHNQEEHTASTRDNQVSYGSEKFRQEAGEIVKQLMEHMKTEAYYSQVVGIQITSGKSFENMYTGSQTVNQRPDYSPSAIATYRNWLKEKYETVEELQKAWNNKKVTFDNAMPPTYEETKYGDGTGAFLNVETQRNVLDHNLYLNDIVTDDLIYFAEIVDEAHEGNLALSCFNGYLFSASGHSDIGAQHTSFHRLLEGDLFDMFVSPANYSERELGNADTYMGFEDSVQAYDKLVIIEEDHRTCMMMHYGGVSWDAQNDYGVGATHTMEDTLYQMKKNTVDSLVSGNGLWFFDMQGGWFDDDQFYGLSQEVANEHLWSLYMQKELDSSDVAYFVDDELVPYFASTYEDLSDGSTRYPSNYITYSGFRLQRRELNRIGQSYDVYGMSTLADGKAKAHKVNVIFAAYQLTEKEREAIETYLQKDGQIILWIYTAGLSDGITDDKSNMEEVIGMPINLSTEYATVNVKVSEEKNAITSGIEGLEYGTQTSFVATNMSPLISVDTSKDKDIEVLGTLVQNGKAGLAMKDMGDWISIYSSAPNVPAALLRNLVELQGGKAYSDNMGDVIWNNGAYVALHSLVGGTKTIYLDKEYAVYDVFEQEFVSMSTDTITYEHTGKDTHLFRLLSPNKVAVLSTTKGGHGTISTIGITELSKGENLKLKITPDDGYEVKSVSINGKMQEITSTVKLENIEENMTVQVQFKKIATGMAEFPGRIVKYIDVPLWMMLSILVIFAGGIFFVTYQVKRYSKKRG